MHRPTPLLVALLVVSPVALVAMAPTAAAAHAATHVTIPGFDGTPLAATLFVPDGATAESPVPYVLMTHGWAGSRATAIDGRVKALLDGGYGVLTWDSRGFGQSGGEVMLNSPDFEVKDVSALLDWLVANAPVQLDGANDPRVGMGGGSYAGGIQLLSVAFDERIDVIAPEITWNDLLQSLAPNGVAKAGWVTLLFGAGQGTSCSAGAGLAPQPTTGCQTSDLARYYATVLATNGVTPEIEQALLHRSPKTYMDRIDVPTLLVQGFPDTLFDVDQAVANFQGIQANGAPAKLVLHDGGHLLPHQSAGFNQATGVVTGHVLAWFDCHLKQAACATGPAVEYYVEGAWRSATAWPPADMAAQAKHVPGVPPLAMGPAPTSQGQFVVDLGGPAAVATLAASGAVEFDVLTTSTEAFVFAALGVRDATGKTVRVGEQTQPVRVFAPALGTPQHARIDLVDVAARVDPGETLVLVLTTADTSFSNQRAPGFVYLENVGITWAQQAA